MKNKKGLIQIPLIIGLMAVVIAIPIIRKITAKKTVVVDNKVVVSNSVPVANAEAEIKIEPSNFSLNTGEKKKATIVIDTSKSNRKVDIARVVLCWQGGLSIADYEKDILIDKDSFSSFVFKKPAKYANLDCVDIVVSSQNPTEKLKSGRLIAADIMFTGTGKASGEFSIDNSLTEVSGPAVTAGQYGFVLGQMAKYNYQVN